MKNLFNNIFFGTNAKLSGLIALAVVGTIALGCNCKDLNLANSSNSDAPSSPAANTTTGSNTVPSNSEVEQMVKETTAQFADAVNSGDFSDLYENASSDFQSTYTVDQVKTAFKTYTDKKSFVVPILRKVQSSNATFSPSPSIRTEKGLNILVASGTFPTKPVKARFDYEYVNRGGDWKLLKLVINLP
ncbi:MAG TPA: hypothetical protein VNA17_06360 [Pyrinomonadaceae bacterium]|nr:hypothetical protein [Pyrinomonadaceae bacterium]